MVGLGDCAYQGNGNALRSPTMKSSLPAGTSTGPSRHFVSVLGRFTLPSVLRQVDFPTVRDFARAQEFVENTPALRGWTQPTCQKEGRDGKIVRYSELAKIIAYAAGEVRKHAQYLSETALTRLVIQLIQEKGLPLFQPALPLLCGGGKSEALIALANLLGMKIPVAARKHTRSRHAPRWRGPVRGNGAGSVENG